MQLTCPACKKTLQCKDELQGKSVKCACGQVFKVAAAPAPAKVAVAQSTGTQSTGTKSVGTKSAGAAGAGTSRAAAAVAAPARPRTAAPPANDALNPFGNISDDEWSSMVQSVAPKKIDDSKPKEKSSSAKMLEQARQETGQGNAVAMDSALGFLNKTRGILVGLGLLCLVRAAVTYWLLSSMIDSIAASIPDPDRLASMKWIVTAFCGVDLGIAVAYIVFGFLVSQFPLTCTISAMVLFLMVEIAGFIANPGSLISIRGWIFRIAIFGGLVQGINNAAYFRHLKAQEREAKKQRR